MSVDMGQNAEGTVINLNVRKIARYIEEHMDAAYKDFDRWVARFELRNSGMTDEAKRAAILAEHRRIWKCVFFDCTGQILVDPAFTAQAKMDFISKTHLEFCKAFDLMETQAAKENARYAE